MTNRNGTQLGYFIDFNLWQDALSLLRFQIEQKKSNKHFNTLSMFYYEKLDVACLNHDSRHYFENFNFELVKVQPLEILIILLKDNDVTNKFRKFCLDKNIITTGDADLIIKFLCQTGFKNDDLDLIEKLKQNIHMNNIIDIFLENKLNCGTPGYYNLSCMKMKSLSDMPDVIEQTRLRILNERSESLSVALNHLVNEIHAVCIRQEQANKKDYDVNSVVKFLQVKGVSHSVRIKVRNLFDRRNSNCVSHPGSNGSHAWDVTKEEYLDYYKHVGKCLDFLL